MATLEIDTNMLVSPVIVGLQPVPQSLHASPSSMHTNNTQDRRSFFLSFVKIKLKFAILEVVRARPEIGQVTVQTANQ